MKMSVRSLAIGLGLLALTAGAAQAQPRPEPPDRRGRDHHLQLEPPPRRHQLQPAGRRCLPASPTSRPTTSATSPTIQAPRRPSVSTTSASSLSRAALASNEVPVVVTSLVAPPAAPTNLQVVPQRHRRGDLVAARRRRRPRLRLQPPGRSHARRRRDRRASDRRHRPGCRRRRRPPAPTTSASRRSTPAASSAESTEVLLAMPAAGACDVPPAPALTTGAWGHVPDRELDAGSRRGRLPPQRRRPRRAQRRRAVRWRHHQLHLPRPAGRHVELRHPGAVRLRCRSSAARHVGAHRRRRLAEDAAAGSGSNTYSFPDFYLDDVIRGHWPPIRRRAAAVLPGARRQQPLAVPCGSRAARARQALGAELEAGQRRRHVAGRRHLQLG